MDLDSVMLNEVSDRERQIPYEFTYMQSLTNKINEQKRTCSYKEKLMVARWEGHGGVKM